MSFALDFSKFQNKTEAQLSKIVRKTALGLFSAVMKGTPIDTGNARFSWYVDMNRFSSNVTTNMTGKASDSGSVAIMNTRITEEIAKYKAGDTITMTNNSDHIETLEYGLFEWADSAKVTNHYSSQAVGGFVRVNVLKFQAMLYKMASQNKG